MATVLAVSSFVARGTVGLRAIMPALDRMGHEVIACPTTVLSNHLGHRRTEGTAVSLETFTAILDALDDNGWLQQVDAVLTGYMPSPGHVEALAQTLGGLVARSPDVLIVCDPVLGDAPDGLYVPRPVADAVRDRLLPLATHLKPNLFELAYLAGQPVESIASPREIVAASRAVPAPVVLTSSVPLAPDRIANIVVTKKRAGLVSVVREPEVPHGTGDLLSALFTAHLVSARDPFDAAASATAAVASAIARSRGSDELTLYGETSWHATPPLSVTQLP